MVAERLAGARRILAVRLDNIGDLIMLGPSLRALARHFPGAEITLLASRAGAQVAPLLPWVRDVIASRPVWQDTMGAVPFDPDREILFARGLRERRFDATFVFTSFNQSPDVPGYVTYLAGIPVRVGHAPLFSGGVFSVAVPPPPVSTHQVDRNLSLLEAVGLPVEDRSLELAVPPAAAARAAALLTEASIDFRAPFAVVAPGASAPSRRYHPDRFGRVAGLLASRSGLPIVLVGHEREAALVSRVGRVAQSVAPSARLVSLAGRTGLAELASVIERSSLVVANDSGPMHLADAFARPQVVLFSGSDLESQWRPRRSPAVLLRRPTTCSPCYAYECPYEMECLDIPPEQVVEEALSLVPGEPAVARVRDPERRDPRAEEARPSADPATTNPANPAPSTPASVQGVRLNA